jgi:hypothetical protein
MYVCMYSTYVLISYIKGATVIGAVESDGTSLRSVVATPAVYMHLNRAVLQPNGLSCNR